MNVRIPHQMTLLLRPYEAGAFDIDLENNEKREVLLEKIQLEVNVLPLFDAGSVLDADYVREAIQAQIDAQLQKPPRSHSTKNNMVFDAMLRMFRLKRRLPHLQQGECLSLRISLGPLRRHPYFRETNHDFMLEIYLNNQMARRSELRWRPVEGSATPQPEEVIPMPEKLFYQGDVPFIMNNHPKQPDTLTLRLDYDLTQSRFVNLKTSPHQLTARVSVEIHPDDSMNQQQLDLLRDAFEIDHVQFLPEKGGQGQHAATLRIPVKHVENLPRGKHRFRVAVSLSPSPLKNEALTCEAPVLLKQAPTFPGHAALDFGTTNSACVYFDPQKGQPTFPDRLLSPLQFDALRDALDKLMTTLEDRASRNDKPYQRLRDVFIECAKIIWREHSGGQVSTIGEIRAYFQTLHQTEGDLKIHRMRAQMLVRWGLVGYQQLRHDYAQTKDRAHDNAAKILAAHYIRCLNEIIDRDIQADTQIFLPELEKDNKEGKISSAMRMDRLMKKTALAKTASAKYPAIDPFHSDIKMGIAIAEDMRKPANHPNEEDENALLEREDQQSDIHYGFVTGAKRWIGRRDHAYFVDRTPAIFNDTYDPICMLGINYLLTQTEQSISNSHHKVSLDELVVTYPANLSQQRREMLRQMIRGMGVRNVDMSFDEATAGALYYIWRELFTDLFAGIDGFLARSHRRINGANKEVFFQKIMVYDMGGGTTDIALVEIEIEPLHILPAATGAGRYFIIRPKIIGLTGRDDFAGDNVTLAVFRILKSKLAQTVAEKLVERKTRPSPEIEEVLKNVDDKFTAWFRLNSDDYKHAYESVKNDINVLVPTEFKSAPERQAAFFDLWNEAEKIKKELSRLKEESPGGRAPSVTAADGTVLAALVEHHTLQLLDRDLNIEVSAEEMERVVKKDIRETFVKARKLCIGLDDKTGKPKIEHYIDQVILAGSSAQLRLIREEISLDVLSKPFEDEDSGSQKKLAAPFKHNGENLIFHAKDAKLAVARGACLPRYFKNVKVDRNDPRITELLKTGINYLDFDTDNLRNYIPFNIFCKSGTGDATAFEAGKQMTLRRKDDSRLFARKMFAPMNVVLCYRSENLNQAKLGKGEYHFQFNLFDEIRRHHSNEHLSEAQLNEFMKQYLFYLEFDDNRMLHCFMYTHTEGCAESRYRHQELEPQDKQAALTLLCDQPQQGTLRWKAGATVTYSSGTGTQEIDLSQKNAISLPFMKEVFFRSADNTTLLWHLSLPDYTPKTPDYAKLRISIELGKEPLLKYSIYDPDFDDPEHNYHIEPTVNENRKMPIFDPFKGEE